MVAYREQIEYLIIGGLALVDGLNGVATCICGIGKTFHIQWCDYSRMTIVFPPNYLSPREYTVLSASKGGGGEFDGGRRKNKGGVKRGRAYTIVSNFGNLEVEGQ